MRHLNEYQHHLRVLLEPYDAKVSRTVLRGESPSNGADLLDWKDSTNSNLVPNFLIYADLIGSGNSRCIEAAQKLKAYGI